MYNFCQLDLNGAGRLWLSDNGTNVRSQELQPATLQRSAVTSDSNGQLYPEILQWSATTSDSPMVSCNQRLFNG